MPSAEQFTKELKGKHGEIVLSLQKDEQGNRSQTAK